MLTTAKCDTACTHVQGIIAPSRTLVFDRQIKAFVSDHLEPLAGEKIIRDARHYETSL